MSLPISIESSELSQKESLARRRILLKQELRRRREENPLEFYWPHAYGCDGQSCQNNKHTHTDYFGTTYTIEGCPQYKFHISESSTTAIFGANQCLGGETLIYDPVKGKERRVESIKENFYVMAWDGKKMVVARALRPFTKDVDKLYKVTLSNGESFVCSGSHVVLTLDGFVQLSELRVKSLLFQPPSIVEFCQLIRVSEERCVRKVEGYPAYPCSYGGQLRVGEGIVQDDFPLQDGVEVHIPSLDGEQMDVRGNNIENNRLCQLRYRLSNQDGRYPHEAHDVDTLSGASYKPYRSIACLLSSEQQPILVSFPRISIPVSLRLGSSSCSTIPYTVSSYSAVISIAYVRRDIKWDFTVPVFHNYYAGGAIHHNSGKTVAGVVNSAFHATGYYPLWYPKSKRLSKANKGRIFGQDFLKSIGEVITPAIEEWFPKASIVDKERNNQGVYVKYVIKHETGRYSTFDCMTYEQPAKLCEGWAGNWVWYDEPPPREHRIATLRGLVAREGFEWFTLTPLTEPYLYDELFSNTKVDSVICDMRHNLYRWNPLINDHIGLTPEAVLRFESSLSDNELQARARGKFMFLAGRIFKIWDRKIHTYDRSQWKAGENGVEVDGEPPIRWKRIMLIDPHPRRPHALLWVAQDPEYKRLFAYREGWLKDATYKDACQFMRQKELAAREKVSLRIMDPNFGPSMEGDSKRTIRELFERASDEINYPMTFSFGDDHKDMARKKIESDFLFYDKTMPVSIINRPNFQVASDMVNFIYQIEHYIWDEYKHADRDDKEKPKDLNSHFPDLLQYLAMYSWDMKEEIVEGPGSFYT